MKSRLNILNIYTIKCNNIDMSTEISFDEDKYKIKSRVVLGKPQVPFMIRFLVNKKIVKNEKTAVILMIVLFLISIVGSFLFLSKSFSVPPAIIDPIIIY